MEVYSSKEALDSDGIDEKEKKMKKANGKKKPIVLLVVFLCIVGIGGVTATAAFLLTKGSDNSSECDETKTEENDKARRLYQKIKVKYTELHPEPLVKNNDGTSTIAPLYLNFTPALYKARTQAATDLLKELESLEKDLVLSKEESLTFELFRRFLVNTFGIPYENNYEIGDWLLGPNIFCWQDSCMLLSSLNTALSSMKPRTVQDIELMVDFMKKCSEGYKQRIRNLNNGVLAGIVLPDVACRAGLRNFKRVHVHVAKNGPDGIFNQTDIDGLINPSILKDIKQEEKLKWNKKHNISVMEYLNRNMVTLVGKSLNDFLRFLENDYSTHCPPSNISSGFASLPLPYVYTNGTPDINKPTTGRLPGGEKFNGSSAYLKLLTHFATYDITPQEVNELADKKLKELFPKVIKIAKARTKEQNESKAIKKFRIQLENDKYFYIVENETTNSELYMKCYDKTTAEKYCPQRWKAMNRWLESAKTNVIQLHEKVHSAFYVKGDKNILPVCNVTVEFDFSPANPYHSYAESDAKCTSTAKIYIPFFLERPGPKYEEISVMAHESYPGHHLEVQGVKEHFSNDCDELRNWVKEIDYFAAFSEGWATYIEKDVADLDMKLYENDMSRYGMLKHQILAALRAKVDVGFHYLGLKRRDAVSLYEKYALDISDGIQKEITRLQSSPGQGTAYLIGEAKFSEYRMKAREKLGKKFNVRDFHYEVLKHGELPMIYLGKYIDEYIQRNKRL